jgi:hypothetical protein
MSSLLTAGLGTRTKTLAGREPARHERGWRAEKRKRYVSVPEHGERLSARHMRDRDGGKRMLISRTFPASAPLSLYVALSASGLLERK